MGEKSEKYPGWFRLGQIMDFLSSMQIQDQEWFFLQIIFV
jgi:hypothetical protein